MVAKKQPKIIIDTREKHPLDFSDSFEIKYAKLDVGDYSIDGLQDILAIERKASCDELLTNFLNSKPRIVAEFEEMAKYKYRFLVVESELSDILNHQSYFLNRSVKKFREHPQMAVGIVMDNVFDLTIKYNINLILAGRHGKRAIKEIINKVWEYEKD